jgi:FtsH-binding integral membrane protein
MNQVSERGYVEESSAVTLVSFLNKVYGWMTGGLLLTAVVAWWVASQCSGRISSGTLLVCVLAEFGLVIGIGAVAHRVPTVVTAGMFLLYSVLNGVTLSLIFYAYKMGSIAIAFYAAAATFGIMAIFGTVTKRDLTRIGTLCFMALIGIVVTQVGLMIYTMITGNSIPMLDKVISALGIVIFTGLTAYDAQKVKAIGEEGGASTGIAILGALALYLDFINLFLFILRLFGSRR